MELKSLIKSSGYYAVQAVYSPSLNSGQVLNSDDSLMLPIQKTPDNSKSTAGVNAVHKCTRPHDLKKRNGKGSNILTLVRTYLNESENWKELKEKQCYQFPAWCFSSPTIQHLHCTPDMKSLHQSSETDANFLWTDIQLSTGQLNKDRLMGDIHKCEAV